QDFAKGDKASHVGQFLSAGIPAARGIVSAGAGPLISSPSSTCFFRLVGSEHVQAYLVWPILAIAFLSPRDRG
ncbi:MAG: hypothetical protein ACREB0_03065, partial [Sphingopyxis sp.]